MADVEMKDATTGENKAKAPVKSSKGPAADGGDSKKRFEVKKVSDTASICLGVPLKLALVECCCSLGLGHCRGQLCHLP